MRECHQEIVSLLEILSSDEKIKQIIKDEFIEIQTKFSADDAELIRNAGAVFIGRFSPVSLGDYSAGSNHVLPTGGCACHSSGLSVQTFLKGVHQIQYDEKSFNDIAATVITLANAEDLPAHGQAMSARGEIL